MTLPEEAGYISMEPDRYKLAEEIVKLVKREVEVVLNMVNWDFDVCYDRERGEYFDIGPTHQKWLESHKLADNNNQPERETK